jgi:hypothetical protein
VRSNDDLSAALRCGVSFWPAPGSILVLMLVADSGAPRLIAPEAVARTESAVPSSSGFEDQKCVPSWVYRPDPMVVSTSVAGLRKARHLQDAEKVLAGSKPHGKFFLDLFCSDAAFTSVIAAGSVSTGFEQSAAVLGSWSQDLCGAMQVVVVARAKEHVVAVSFDLKHVLSAKYRCDDRAFATAQDCAARDECLKVLFADAAWQEHFREDLRKAFDALVFKP